MYMSIYYTYTHIYIYVHYCRCMYIYIHTHTHIQGTLYAYMQLYIFLSFNSFMCIYIYMVYISLCMKIYVFIYCERHALTHAHGIRRCVLSWQPLFLTLFVPWVTYVVNRTDHKPDRCTFPRMRRQQQKGSRLKVNGRSRVRCEVVVLGSQNTHKCFARPRSGKLGLNAFVFVDLSGSFFSCGQQDKEGCRAMSPSYG